MLNCTSVLLADISKIHFFPAASVTITLGSVQQICEFLRR